MRLKRNIINVIYILLEYYYLLSLGYVIGCFIAAAINKYNTI